MKTKKVILVKQAILPIVMTKLIATGIPWINDTSECIVREPVFIWPETRPSVVQINREMKLEEPEMSQRDTCSNWVKNQCIGGAFALAIFPYYILQAVFFAVVGNAYQFSFFPSGGHSPNGCYA